MLESEDLYEILQVHPSAHPEIIEVSYRQLLQLYAPDQYPYPNVRKMLEAVDHAYEVLHDPTRRAMYDQYRKARGGQAPDVIQAKSFQLLDDEGNVRAELGCRIVRHDDSFGTEPMLEMKDSFGHVRFSVSLDYFDRPQLVLGDVDGYNDQASALLRIDSDGAQMVLQDENGTDRLGMESDTTRLVMRDRAGALRFLVGLLGGDESDSPRLIMRDGRGKTRFEVELYEVELDQLVAQVGDDYELSPLHYDFPARLRMRDEDGIIRLEAGLFGTDPADSPRLYLLDDKGNLRLEIGYSNDSPRIIMKDKAGNDRFEIELAEVEADGCASYILRVLDENKDIRFEMGLPSQDNGGSS